MVRAGPILRGENKPTAKLTADKVREIKIRYKTSRTTYEELAREYGVSSGLIGHVVRGRVWKHL